MKNGIYVVEVTSDNFCGFSDYVSVKVDDILTLAVKASQLPGANVGQYWEIEISSNEVVKAKLLEGR